MRIIEVTAAAERKKQLDALADALEASGEAYNALFQGSTAEIVLQDLAKVTGYFTTLPDTASHAEHVAHNARRAIFERIVNLAEVNGTRVAAIRHSIAVAETSQKVRSG